MANEKKTPAEELKWWIDRGPVKEREKERPAKGIIEKWVYELLKDYSQEQAIRGVVDINRRLLGEVPVRSGEWGYYSLGIGSYPAKALARIKSSLRLPPGARAITIDAGYSVRVLITGEPPGERLLDINFTEAPSLDFWLRGELMEERLFSSVDEAVKKLGASLSAYLSPPDIGHEC